MGCGVEGVEVGAGGDANLRSRAPVWAVSHPGAGDVLGSETLEDGGVGQLRDALWARRVEAGGLSGGGHQDRGVGGGQRREDGVRTVMAM